MWVWKKSVWRKQGPVPRNWARSLCETIHTHSFQSTNSPDPFLTRNSSNKVKMNSPSCIKSQSHSRSLPANLATSPSWWTFSAPWVSIRHSTKGNPHLVGVKRPLRKTPAAGCTYSHMPSWHLQEVSSTQQYTIMIFAPHCVTGIGYSLAIAMLHYSIQSARQETCSFVSLGGLQYLQYFISSEVSAAVEANKS